jgi:hypothetical protein
MHRLWLFVFVLGLAAGCAGDGHQWDEAWKDFRGDNMQMMSDRKPLVDHP